MARSFASASSQYLAYSAGGLSAEPLTLAAWAYPLQTNAFGVLAATNNTSNTNGYYRIALLADATVQASKRDDSGNGSNRLATASYTANQWCHVCGVFETNEQRYVYLNGGNKGTGAAAYVIDPTADNITIGASVRSDGAVGLFNGYIAHAAIWSAALSDAEVARLYNSGIGADPRSVRPDALVAYWPLINGDGDQDYWRNYHMTATNSPTYAQHPPVLMRSRPKYVILGSAAPTVGEVTITGTRTIGETITANATPTPGDATLTYQWEKSSTGSGSGTDISGETASTLALTYADFGDILDTAAYVRCGVVATKDAVPSVETFSSWLEVSAGGAASVGSPFVSSSIR